MLAQLTRAIYDEDAAGMIAALADDEVTYDLAPRERRRWRITHMHNSVPFAMDGSNRALLDLRP